MERANPFSAERADQHDDPDALAAAVWTPPARSSPCGTAGRTRAETAEDNPSAESVARGSEMIHSRRVRFIVIRPSDGLCPLWYIIPWKNETRMKTLCIRVDT